MTQNFSLCDFVWQFVVTSKMFFKFGVKHNHLIGRSPT